MVGGYISLLYSTCKKPLEYWSKQNSPTGRIKKILDAELFETVIELQDVEFSNKEHTSILCPKNHMQLLDVKLPILVLILKDIDNKFYFQLQILDTEGVRHYLRFDARQEKEINSERRLFKRVQLNLKKGWNKLEIDLRQLLKDAFGSKFKAVQKLKIFANCRLRRIYFTDKFYDDISLSIDLFHSFIDFFMRRWGIHLVDKSSQTEENNTQENSRSKKKNAKNKENSKISINIDSIFLKTVQEKTTKVIEDFFKNEQRQGLKINDLKNKAQIKSYVDRNCRISRPVKEQLSKYNEV